MRLFRQKTNKEIYEKNREEFKKLVAMDQNRPTNIQDLTFSMYDLNGKSYYVFNDSLDMPLERLAKIEEYKIWVASGLHSNVVDQLCDSAEEILAGGLTKGKGAAKLGLILSEIRERKNMSVPVELLYNILAVQLIREDENPNSFHNEIHLQKIVALKDITEKQGSFFFGMKELRLLHDWLNMSEVEWKEYWQSSITMHNRRTQALKQVLGG